MPTVAGLHDSVDPHREIALSAEEDFSFEYAAKKPALPKEHMTVMKNKTILSALMPAPPSILE
jgi:hypothetical protein